MMQGLISFLLSSHPEAALLRREVTWVIMPMLNPDGVFLGNYRSGHSLASSKCLCQVQSWAAVSICASSQHCAVAMTMLKPDEVFCGYALVVRAKEGPAAVCAVCLPHL